MTTMTELQFRRISLPTGVHLHCAEAGPADGTPLAIAPRIFRFVVLLQPNPEPVAGESAARYSGPTRSRRLGASGPAHMVPGNLRLMRSPCSIHSASPRRLLWATRWAASLHIGWLFLLRIASAGWCWKEGRLALTTTSYGRLAPVVQALSDPVDIAFVRAVPAKHPPPSGAAGISRARDCRKQ